MSAKESLHQRLERLRKQAGLSAAEMARSINEAESTYREWEKGRGLRLPPLQQISQVLAISVTELVTGEKPAWQDVLTELAAIEQNLHQLRTKLSSRS